MAYLSSGHVGPLPSDSGISIQRIADVLAGSGLRAVRLDYVEVAAIHNALHECQGNRTHAAKALHISLRSLQRKLKAMGYTGLTLGIGPTPGRESRQR